MIMLSKIRNPEELQLHPLVTFSFIPLLHLAVMRNQAIVLGYPLSQDLLIILFMMKEFKRSNIYHVICIIRIRAEQINHNNGEDEQSICKMNGKIDLTCPSSLQEHNQFFITILVI